MRRGKAWRQANPGRWAQIQSRRQNRPQRAQQRHQSAFQQRRNHLMDRELPSEVQGSGVYGGRGLAGMNNAQRWDAYKQHNPQGYNELMRPQEESRMTFGLLPASMRYGAQHSWDNMGRGARDWLQDQFMSQYGSRTPWEPRPWGSPVNALTAPTSLGWAHYDDSDA